MGLCGFLAPNGTYTECPSWSHLSTAIDICNNVFKKDFYSGIEAEDFLFNNGYIEFNARGASKRYIVDKKILLLSDEQKDFLVKNLENTNNQEQKDAIMEILDYDDGYREDSILNHYERKIVN